MTAYETFIENYNNSVDDLVLEQSIKSVLFNSESSIEEINKLFSSYRFSKHISEATLLQCIDLYAEDKRLQTFMNVICRFIKTHLSVTGTDKYNFVLKYIISENGYKRMFGRHLWDELNMEHSDINILNQSEEVQGRFALSILQDIMFPQNRLPKLLPLFNSPYESVRHILIFSLSTYTLNYFGTVKRMFEEGNYVDSKELSLFKKYIKQCDTKFDMYHNCKELHSQYFLPDEYEIACRQVTDNMRERMNESLDENKSSIFNLLTPVVLGRGGGFRDENGTVQPLGHFSYSQEMPMMLHGLSPLESIEYTNNVLFKDWRDCVKKDETKNS